MGEGGYLGTWREYIGEPKRLHDDLDKRRPGEEQLAVSNISKGLHVAGEENFVYRTGSKGYYDEMEVGVASPVLYWNLHQPLCCDLNIYERCGQE